MSIFWHDQTAWGACRCTGHSGRLSRRDQAHGSPRNRPRLHCSLLFGSCQGFASGRMVRAVRCLLRFCVSRGRLEADTRAAARVGSSRQGSNTSGQRADFSASSRRDGRHSLRAQTPADRSLRFRAIRNSSRGFHDGAAVDIHKIPARTEGSVVGQEAAARQAFNHFGRRVRGVSLAVNQAAAPVRSMRLREKI
jgi:hypothetical protein